MLLLRNPSFDKFKSPCEIKKALAGFCKAPDCKSTLTLFKGPGDRHLCRIHQIQQREYGGLGRIDRPWTFSREWACAWCGYSPKEDEWFDNTPIPFDNEVHKNRAMRSMLVGDHSEDRNVDGGSHGKDNVQTLCQNCNSKKTVLYKDYKQRAAQFVCETE